MSSVNAVRSSSAEDVHKSEAEQLLARQERQDHLVAKLAENVLTDQGERATQDAKDVIDASMNKVGASSKSTPPEAVTDGHGFSMKGPSVAYTVNPPPPPERLCALF